MTISYNTIRIKKEVLFSKTCDKCKKTFLVDDNKNIYELQEFLHINFEGGYGSIFGDGSKIKADICQHCLFEIIKNFCRKE